MAQATTMAILYVGGGSSSNEKVSLTRRCPPTPENRLFSSLTFPCISRLAVATDLILTCAAVLIGCVLSAALGFFLDV